MHVNGQTLTPQQILELALRGTNQPRGVQPLPTKLDLNTFDEPQCEEHYLADTYSES